MSIIVSIKIVVKFENTFSQQVRFIVVKLNLTVAKFKRRNINSWLWQLCSYVFESCHVDLPFYLIVSFAPDCTLVKNFGTFIMPKVLYNAKITLKCQNYITVVLKCIIMPKLRRDARTIS